MLFYVNLLIVRRGSASPDPSYMSPINTDTSSGIDIVDVWMDFPTASLHTETADGLQRQLKAGQWVTVD